MEAETLSGIVELAKLRIAVRRLADVTPCRSVERDGCPEHFDHVCKFCGSGEWHNPMSACNTVNWKAARHREDCLWVYAKNLCGEGEEARNHQIVSRMHLPLDSGGDSLRIRTQTIGPRVEPKRVRPTMTEDERRAWWLAHSGEELPTSGSGPLPYFVVRLGDRLVGGVLPPWMTMQVGEDIQRFHSIQAETELVQALQQNCNGVTPER